MVIFFNFSPTSNHLLPLQVENCDSNSRLVVDEDDNGKLRLERVEPWTTKGFLFEIIINVFVSSFLFIWISMWWVYGHHKYFNSFSVVTVFIRQNLRYLHVRFWRIKTIPEMKGLIHFITGIIAVLGKEMSVWTSKFANAWNQIEQVSVVFTKMQLFNLAVYGVI